MPKREPKLQAPPSRNGGRALRAPTWLSLIGSSHREPRTTMIAYVLARSRRVTRLVRANRTTVHSVHHQDVGAGAMRRPGGSSPRPARAARTSVHSERRPKRVRTIALLHPPAMPKKTFAPPGRTSRKRTVRTREYAYGRLPGCKKRRGRYRIPLCPTNATSALQLIAPLKEPYTSASTISARACMPREPGGIGGTRSATHTSPRPRGVSSAGPKKKGPAEPLPSIATTTIKKRVRHDPMHHA